MKICVLLTLTCCGRAMKKIKNGKFPDDFLIGAATSALQVESAWNIDGKGPSIWDTFTHQHPEKIADGSNTGDVANSYYLYEEDIKAVKNMGVSDWIIAVIWNNSRGFISFADESLSLLNRVVAYFARRNYSQCKSSRHRVLQQID